MGFCQPVVTNINKLLPIMGRVIRDQDLDQFTDVVSLKKRKIFQVLKDESHSRVKLATEKYFTFVRLKVTSFRTRKLLSQMLLVLLP